MSELDNTPRGIWSAEKRSVTPDPSPEQVEAVAEALMAKQRELINGGRLEPGAWAPKELARAAISALLAAGGAGLADRIEGMAGNASLVDSPEALEALRDGLLALADDVRLAAGGEREAYPYQEGDSLTIGPECIAALDASAIIWKGQHYSRTPDPEAREDEG